MSEEGENDLLELLSVRWKTELCNSGESCWCRLIVPETDVPLREGLNAWVVPDGSISKAEAEHVVQLHNSWLERTP